MNNTLLLCTLAGLLGVCFAEPPSFRQRNARRFLERQELPEITTSSFLETTTYPQEETFLAAKRAPYPPAGYRPHRGFNLPTEEEPKEDVQNESSNAPYPPSGWKPQGPEFFLPTERKAIPENVYGPPARVYTPPSNKYGPPAPEKEYGPPAKEYAAPAQEYGPPSQEYGPPQRFAAPKNSYGPPEEDLPESEIPNDDDVVTVEAAEAGIGNKFYILQLADGSMQKIYYAATPNNEAELKVQPLSGPKQQTPARFIKAPARQPAPRADW